MSGDWGVDMVILAREIGGSVILDKTISLTVLGMLGNTVRLGIDGPSSMIIERKDRESKSKEQKHYC